MIAWAGIEHMVEARRTGASLDGMSFAPRPRWPLDETSAGLLGAGKKGAKV